MDENEGNNNLEPTEVDSDWNDEASIVNDKCAKFLNYNRGQQNLKVGVDSI